MKTTGNTVLVTGGGSGIGLALTEALVRRGNHVVICGRRRDTLQAVRARLPDVQYRVCDLTRPRARRGLVDWILSDCRSLNMLVNNAGIQRPVDFLKGPRDLPLADAEIATNLEAPIHLAAELVPHLRRKKRAAIVNISSGLAFTPLAVVPVYCATKAAIHSWSVSLRCQLRNTSVRVFEVAPPIVATGLGGERGRSEADEHVTTAEAVAAGILRALGRDRYEVALGAAAHLRKGREALFPVING